MIIESSFKSSVRFYNVAVAVFHTYYLENNPLTATGLSQGVG